MKEKLIPYLRAGYSCLDLLTHEEARATAEIAAAAKELDYQVWSWSCTTGLQNQKGEGLKGTKDPLVALDNFYQFEMEATDELNVDGDQIQVPQGTHIKNKSVVILKDMHMFMKGGNPVLVRRFRDCIEIGRATNRHIIILGCQLHLPPELEKEVTVIEFTLPGKDDLLVLANEAADLYKVELNGSVEAVLNAGSGLTTIEFSDAIAYSIVKTKKIEPDILSAIKSDTIKKQGILEVITTRVTLDEVGGLDLLKAKLWSQRNMFSNEAKAFGLPTPRPLLACGQAGVGKTLTATATATVFNLPLLRLEAGRLFGGTVGESERNWRTAFATAKAIAPCVVHIDEIDGLFEGAQSSGKTDGGTTSRVIKAILMDLQSNSDGLFFVFTANNIDGLPDPLIDRCDVWSVDLPNLKERQAIWSIHIAKRKRNPDDFDLVALAKASDGFSGRQIEQAWIAGLTEAFNDGMVEPTTPRCLSALGKMVATSITMKEVIEARRKRLAHCASPASTPDVQAVTKLSRKIA